MRQTTGTRKSPGEKLVKDINARRASSIHPRRRSGSSWMACVAKTALLSCVVVRAFPKASITNGRRTSWKLKTLPLWLEFDGLQIAHACWSEEAMKIVKKRRPTGHLQLEDLEEVAAKTTEFALAVETITSGPEAKLPVGYSFTDNGGNKREHVRLSWWNAENTTWRKAALSVPDLSHLPTDELPPE